MEKTIFKHDKKDIDKMRKDLEKEATIEQREIIQSKMQELKMKVEG